MNKDHQVETETHKIEHYEDEIELIDILRVIWKWKYFILAGTVICGLIAAIISFNMTKLYSIDMVLRPGILSVGEEGKNVYIDSPQNIKALIDSGIFNNDIMKYLDEIKMDNIPKKLEFKVTILKDSDTIKVEYETDDIKQGMVIKGHLSKLLLEKYSNKVTYFKNELDMKLSIIKSEIDYIRTNILSYKRNVKNIEKRIDELTSEIKLIKNNTANLIKERNKLLSDSPKDKNILSALIYSNTIQQNLQLSNNYQNEINEYKQKKEDELQKIEEAENTIDNKSIELKSLQFKKDSIQNIQIIQPATSSRYPVKPKKLLIIASASLFGLFLMIVLFFLVEFVSRNKIIETD
jgi:LPS O-antigen subunit length determinant protein (WzzB/FepE family)